MRIDNLPIFFELPTSSSLLPETTTDFIDFSLPDQTVALNNNDNNNTSVDTSPNSDVLDSYLSNIVQNFFGNDRTYGDTALNFDSFVSDFVYDNAEDSVNILNASNQNNVMASNMVSNIQQENFDIHTMGPIFPNFLEMQTELPEFISNSYVSQLFEELENSNVSEQQLFAVVNQKIERLNDGNCLVKEGIIQEPTYISDNAAELSGFYSYDPTYTNF